MVEREVAMQLKGIQQKTGQMMQQKIYEHGLTFGNLHFMMAVEKHPDKNQKFYAKEMRLTQGALSGMVKHLLKLGMLQQIPLEIDMRFNRLVLTEKGQQIIDDCKEDLYVRYRDMFMDFSEDELIELNRYLLKINNNLEKIII